MKHIVDKNFFPGWTRKAVTFTIDDGNVEMDKLFLSYVRPAGILGTFNLCGDRLDRLPREELLALYDGYGIANHCRYHPFCMKDGIEYRTVDEVFDEKTADPELLYRHPKIDGLYLYHGPRGWRRMATPEAYIRMIEESRADIEEAFGEGYGRSFVIPFSRTVSEYFENWVRTSGVRSVRGYIGGGADPTDDFSLPKDRSAWSFNARNSTLAAEAERFEGYPDDGRLHWLCFGVHSIDYETGGNWGDLNDACDRLGNRPESYYTASVDTIFDYEDAIGALTVTDDAIVNPSALDLCVTVDGVRRTVPRRSTLPL